jgi:hypothetical protein
MRYCTDVGPVHGPAFYRGAPGHVDILGDPSERAPIGTALCVGVGEGGIALWCLIVGGDAMPGRWILIDREFRPRIDAT